ncbi:methyltransferase [Kibdelosporangium aridum]|nr:methyltransferase [Kibdelosporangium aridum]
MTSVGERVISDVPGTRNALVLRIYGFMISQLIHTAVELGIPDRLRDRPTASADLAAEAGTAPQPTHRLLRALAAVGVLDEPEQDRFVLSSFGEPLAENTEHSLSAITKLFCSPEVLRSWSELTHSIRTGESAFEHIHGMGLFPYLGGVPELAETFHTAMSENARFELPSIAAGYDFGQFRTIVDVGGGNGTLLSAILTRHPGTRGVLLDTAVGAAEATALLAANGLAERCDVVAGDFLESVPSGGDAYLIKSVLHNWDDDRVVRVLRNCRQAMGTTGTLLLIEPVVPAVTGPDTRIETVLSDLNMLVMTAGGKERTERQFRELLAAAGFILVSVTAPLPGTDLRVLQAKPV